MPARGSRRYFYRRTFLNRPGHHAGAYALGEIRLYRCSRPRRQWYVDAFLKLADCDRVVTLDFDAGSRREAANALRKARFLRDLLTAYADALARAIEDAEGPAAAKPAERADMTDPVHTAERAEREI